MNQNLREYDDVLFEHYARVGKAFSSATRVEMLDILSNGPRSVEVLASQMGESVANISRHLQLLREARLVIGKRRGRSVFYHITDSRVMTLLAQMREFAELHYLEIDKTRRDFCENRIGFDPVSKTELLQLLRDGEAIAIDVRPAEEYKTAHLSGALSIPLEQLEQLMKDLPDDREIIAYCRGPHCVLSVEAVQLLRNKGFRAHRVELGPAEFTNAGFSVVRPGSSYAEMDLGPYIRE